MKTIKPFYIWWVTLLLVISATLWAWNLGYVAKIWHDDITHITTLLAIMFAITMLMVGKISYVGTVAQYTHKKLIDACWFLSEQMLAIGMLGTVLGFIYVLSSGINTASITDASSLSTLLANMSVGLGIALYTNAIGIISSLIIKGLLYTVTYDHEE